MEAPYLSKFQEKYGKQGFTVIAVNGWDESRDVVTKFAEREKLKQKILLMGGTVAASSFGVRSYPTNFFIDHEGKVLGRELGFHPAMVPKMEERIARLLAKRKAASAGS